MLGVAFFTLASFAALAQEDAEEVQQGQGLKARDKIQAARIAYITEQLKLTPEEAEQFWPIYREFSEKRLQLQKEYRQAKKNPDPNKSAEENDKELVDLGLKVKQQELDLEKEYSARLLKVISAQKLRTLPEAEKKFRLLILEQIRRRQMHQERRLKQRDR